MRNVVQLIEPPSGEPLPLKTYEAPMFVFSTTIRITISAHWIELVLCTLHLLSLLL